jgi:hypothetical protein
MDNLEQLDKQLAQHTAEEWMALSKKEQLTKYNECKTQMAYLSDLLKRLKGTIENMKRKLV